MKLCEVTALANQKGGKTVTTMNLGVSLSQNGKKFYSSTMTHKVIKQVLVVIEIENYTLYQ